MEETVLDLKKALKKSIEASKWEHCCDILKRLAEITATKELLKRTEIGIEVSKLKRHEDTKVAALALGVLNRWKKDVGIKPSSAPAHPSPPPSSDAPSSKHVLLTTSKPASDPAAAPSSVHAEPRLHSTSSPDLPSTDTSFPNPSSDPTYATNGDSFPERSVTLDLIQVACTGNPTRNKCIEMLYNALCVNTLVSSEAILQTANVLERSLLDKHHGQVTAQYKADVRMFFANLKHKQNASLREAVLSGQVSVSQFIQMTPAEMAPGSLKKEMEEMKKVNLFLARAAGNTKAETDLFKCGKCKKRRTSYYQLQTRSADEPMTTFVECLECGHHWKFC